MAILTEGECRMNCSELKERFRKELQRLQYYRQFRLQTKEYSTKKGISLYYSLIKKVDGELKVKYIGRRNKTVDMISACKYLDKSIKMIESGASVRDVDPNYLRHQLSKPYQTLPKFIYDLAGVINFEEWMSKPRIFNDNYPKKKCFATKSGWMVRSKSEGMIADLLLEYRVPFVYEEVIDVDGYRIAPDFILLSPVNYSELIYEHFGKMDDEEYVKKANWKIRQYIKAGYIPGVDLIITYECRDLPLTRQTLKKIFDLHFGRAICM